jgi:hypothetical protein
MTDEQFFNFCLESEMQMVIMPFDLDLKGRMFFPGLHFRCRIYYP